MEKIFERVHGLRIATRVSALSGVALALTASCFFFVIQNTEDSIVALQHEQAALDRQQAEKRELADNLTDRRRELDQLEISWQAALLETPEQKDIAPLMTQLSDVARKSGLELTRIIPGAEVGDRVFAHVPVAMSVAGSYEEIAMFMQEIANLQRIVNVQNVRLSAPTVKNDKTVLHSEFLATTFHLNTPTRR